MAENQNITERDIIVHQAGTITSMAVELHELRAASSTYRKHFERLDSQLKNDLKIITDKSHLITEISRQNEALQKKMVDAVTREDYDVVNRSYESLKDAYNELHAEKEALQTEINECYRKYPPASANDDMTGHEMPTDFVKDPVSGVPYQKLSAEEIDEMVRLSEYKRSKKEDARFTVLRNRFRVTSEPLDPTEEKRLDSLADTVELSDAQHRDWFLLNERSEVARISKNKGIPPGDDEYPEDDD